MTTCHGRGHALVAVGAQCLCAPCPPRRPPCGHRNGRLVAPRCGGQLGRGCGGSRPKRHGWRCSGAAVRSKSGHDRARTAPITHRGRPRFTGDHPAGRMTGTGSRSPQVAPTCDNKWSHRLQATGPPGGCVHCVVDRLAVGLWVPPEGGCGLVRRRHRRAARAGVARVGCLGLGDTWARRLQTSS